jgi:ectoine hydrolase
MRFGHAKIRPHERQSRGISHRLQLERAPRSQRPADTAVLEVGVTFHFIAGLWIAYWGLATTKNIVIIICGAPKCLANIERTLFVKI